MTMMTTSSVILNFQWGRQTSSKKTSSWWWFWPSPLMTPPLGRKLQKYTAHQPQPAVGTWIHCSFVLLLCIILLHIILLVLSLCFISICLFCVFVFICHFIIYRQSPVKSPDIKNIIVVTLTFLYIVTVSYSFTQFSTLAKIHTTTAREPSIYLCLCVFVFQCLFLVCVSAPICYAAFFVLCVCVAIDAACILKPIDTLTAGSATAVALYCIEHNAMQMPCRYLCTTCSCI